MEREEIGIRGGLNPHLEPLYGSEQLRADLNPTSQRAYRCALLIILGFASLIAGVVVGSLTNQTIITLIAGCGGIGLMISR